MEVPSALLEGVVSAGLCLYPDRYSYRYTTRAGIIALDPGDRASSVILTSRLIGMPPALRLPDIVWRAAIDIEPRVARDARDRAWLPGLLGPGEGGRRARREAARALVGAN